MLVLESQSESVTYTLHVARGCVKLPSKQTNGIRMTLYEKSTVQLTSVGLAQTAVPGWVVKGIDSK